MARVKLSIDFDAFNVYQKKLNEIGGNATKRAVNSALKASQKIVANKVNAAMSTHNKTGEVKETIITDLPVEWTGDTASVPVGFKIVNVFVSVLRHPVLHIFPVGLPGPSSRWIERLVSESEV